MSEPDPVQPDNIGFDDTAYHEFLQRQTYLESLNYPVNPNPSLKISEPNSSQPTSGLSPGSILRTVIQQNLPRGMHNLKFPGDDDVNKFDILHWWREHQKHFPILSIIAKQILTTPVSIVAVEQEFSTGGNILDARQSFLSLESIQVQVCVDDWTKVEYRKQEMELEVIYDFFNDDHTTGTGTEDND
ncbi:hypothetical protein Ddye_023919 [Dipteronia dyeriana]|uniref:HAT C-terminal dimerisation domain-containing protein n=1 Tax=Dipteronia dyeriana TaxID=168575 RepID=A0AAD9TUG2_9ROSI|nr:hypothetical protein Ddye_023919 [Dipteronia dyeriana]